jgi:hypothetical protein
MVVNLKKMNNDVLKYVAPYFNLDIEKIGKVKKIDL